MELNRLEYKTAPPPPINRLLIFGVFACLFLGIFIFFRFACPVIPWDGDDWSTIAGFMNASNIALPRLDKIFVGENRFFPMLCGTFFGYVAAFIVYPLTGDYVMSFVIVTAFVLALSITITFWEVYCLIFKLTESGLISVLSVLFFTVGAFLIFKTNGSGSVYLYWQYNYCTAYWYSIPSYLSSAFALKMIGNYIDKVRYALNFRTGLLICVLYFLIFSFLPAAFLLAAVALCILMDSLVRIKKLFPVICEQWFYLLTLIFFAINLLLEFYFTFGMGYFQAPSGIGQRLMSSAQFVFSSFSQMNKLFLIPAAVTILCAVGGLLWKRWKQCLTEDDWRIVKTGLILTSCFLLAGIFYILFGTIDLWHISADGLIRMDTLYGFYFLLLTVSAMCFAYVQKCLPQTVILAPLVISIMFYTVVSPRNTYSGSIYDVGGSNAKQRYQVVSAAVEEIQTRVSKGQDQLTVYVPYSGWGGGGLSFPLFIHHVTDRFCTVEFIYQDDIDAIYFE